ncbi:MAG TPA: nucleotidyltransferase domain-containing protein [Anaerolineae bacterium]|nr:nucleotidyltransferase domain-containing protein [Anaerolineae bacterium]
MTTTELIADMTARIARDFDPLRIILFGSHARGDSTPDSDIDLLVVLHERN